jgi:hypothetical protein
MSVSSSAEGIKMLENYPISKYVKMLFACQKHDYTKDKLEGLIKDFEAALDGFDQSTINNAFIAFVRANPFMPSPDEILSAIKKHNIHH